jgi:hypothetical protein
LLKMAWEGWPRLLGLLLRLLGMLPRLVGLLCMSWLQLAVEVTLAPRLL